MAWPGSPSSAAGWAAPTCAWRTPICPATAGATSRACPASSTVGGLAARTRTTGSSSSTSPCWSATRRTSPTREVRFELRRGAAGNFDHHFRRLAERLVDLDVPDTVIVLGWEMNGMTYTHRCGPDPEAWKKYWNRIVTTMRAVPGQKFRFDFAPNRGRDAIPWTQCYPGDDTVDIIGMDSYDQPRGQSFDEAGVGALRASGARRLREGPRKADFLSGMGALPQRRQPDVHEAHARVDGRAQAAVQHAHRLLPARRVAVRGQPQGVRDLPGGCSSAAPTTTPLPKPTDPTPKPTAPTPVPKPTPVHPPNCSPLELGDWVEYWLGGKLCLRFDWWSRHR